MNEITNIDEAWEALKALTWGGDLAPLAAIDRALSASHGNEESRADLEHKLVAILPEASEAGRDFICRRLAGFGSNHCVETVAGMLTEASTSHATRMVLESLGSAEAAAALRIAATKAVGAVKIGLLGSLAKLHDAESVSLLAELGGSADSPAQQAAAFNLGQIGGASAIEALMGMTPVDDAAKVALTDAALRCAEKLLAAGENSKARDLYRKFAVEEQPAYVRLAANKGVLSSMRR